MGKIFENQQLAIGNWQLAKANPRNICNLLLIGIGSGIGWPLGGPSVAQGPPKRQARVAHASNGGSTLFATKVEKWGVGEQNLTTDKHG